MGTISFLFFLPTFLSPFSLAVLWTHNAILEVEIKRIDLMMRNLRFGQESEPFQEEYFELRRKLNTLKRNIISTEATIGIFLVFLAPLVNWMVILYLAIVALFSSTASTSIRKFYSSMFLK